MAAFDRIVDNLEDDFVDDFPSGAYLELSKLSVMELSVKIVNG